MSKRNNDCDEGFRYQTRIDQCVGEFLKWLISTLEGKFWAVCSRPQTFHRINFDELHLSNKTNQSFAFHFQFISFSFFFFCYSFATYLYFYISFFIWFYVLRFAFKQQTNDSILSDINECSEESDDCNRKTQLCLNTRGGYKCQEKIGDKCLPGLKYNSETKLCEGGCFFFFFFLCLALTNLNWFSVLLFLSNINLAH